MAISKLAGQLDIETCLEFDAGLLVPEQRIRDYCVENKCGNYGSNYMCPPYIGTVDETKSRLAKFLRGVLFQYVRIVDVRNDYAGVMQTKVDFHEKVLRMEEFYINKGITLVWGMMGGSCGLCEVCGAGSGKPCPYPDKARMSLESIAIDVVSLLDKLGLDSKFHHDKITWTGCVLF